MTSTASGLAPPQLGQQHPLQVGVEHGAAGGPLHAHRGQHALPTERPEHAQPGPGPVRDGTARPLAARAAAVQAGHARQHAALVQEHQPFRREPAHARLVVHRPRGARRSDVRPVLLGGAQGCASFTSSRTAAAPAPPSTGAPARPSAPPAGRGTPRA